MAFNVNFSPVGTLVSLASAAGQAQAAQRTQTLLAAQYQHQDDLRLRTQQLQQAGQQTAQEMNLRERAMQLQEAAAARIAGTPTSYQQTKERLALDFEGRKMLRQEADQEKQDQQNRELEALNVYRNTDSSMTEKQYNTLRLGIMSDATGGSVMRALTAGDVAGTPAALEKQKVILGKAVAAIRKYDTYLARSAGTSAMKAGYEKARTDIDSQMRAQYGPGWETLPNTPDFTGLEQGVQMSPGTEQSYDLPMSKSQLVGGRLYRTPQGNQYWDAAQDLFVNVNPHAVAAP